MNYLKTIKRMSRHPEEDKDSREAFEELDDGRTPKDSPYFNSSHPKSRQVKFQRSRSNLSPVQSPTREQTRTVSTSFVKNNKDRIERFDFIANP